MDTNCIRTILIRGTNWVGDALMTTPAVAAIRRNFPEARISMLVVPWVMDIFTHNPHIDEVIPYFREGRHKGIQGKMALLKELRERKFDLSILLQNAFEAALLAWGARIPRRAGYNTDMRGLLLTHAVAMRPEYKKMHQTRYYLAMVKGLGLEAPDLDMFLHVPDEYTTPINSRLKGIGIPGEAFDRARPRGHVWFRQNVARENGIVYWRQRLSGILEQAWLFWGASKKRPSVTISFSQ